MITTLRQNCLISNILLISSGCCVTALQLEDVEEVFVEMKVILQKKNHDPSHESQDEFTIHPQKR